MDVETGLISIRKSLIKLNDDRKFTYKVKHNGEKYELYKQHHHKTRMYSTTLAKSSKVEPIKMVVGVLIRNYDFV